MPRIIGIDIPKDKKIYISLTYIYGVGRFTALSILKKANIDADRMAKDLTDEEISRVSSVMQKEYKTEGDLKREVSDNTRRLMDIGTYRGLRHRRGLPARGQRTKTNARTRKGPRRTMGAKKGSKK